METLVRYINDYNTYIENFGFSGEASEQICEKIGKCNYNMLLNFDFAMKEVDENGELKVRSNIL